ncbi:MAG: hypothetical protein IPK19_00115 [Chloroflexi bacterium]|nr:hypothetical protein [Chloroflexota bacterium]
MTPLVVEGAVQLQGRPTAPDARWVTPLHVLATPEGSAIPVLDQQLLTDESGHFELNGLTPGNYHLWVKGSHTLAVAQTVTVTSGANQVAMGTLRRAMRTTTISSTSVISLFSQPPSERRAVKRGLMGVLIST